MSAYGPMQPLYDYLSREDHVQDGDKDRKQSDMALARQLSADDFTAAIQAASFDQMDLVLAHDALAVERKPLSCLFLLTVKATKLDQWLGRKGAPSVDIKRAQHAASATLLTQVSQFLFQVPIYVAVREIKRLSQLTTLYVALAVELRQSIKAVFPLKSFLRRFHQHGNTVVTPFHGSFFYLCLQAKCYAAASDILNQPLFEVHAQSNVVSTVDFLGYAYYGGVLCLGQKKYQQAMEYFLSAVTAPAVALSAFVVDAYKKLVLASLIWNGDMPTLPKYTPFVVTRHLDVHCGPYVELGRAFGSTEDNGNSALNKVISAAETHAAAFTNDGNFGLVKQVIDALQQRKLQQLPRTYVTIALSEMAQAATEMDTTAVEADAVAATEKRLLQLIATGEMAAVIDKQNQMVTFVLDNDDNRGDRGDAKEEVEQMVVMHKLQSEMEKILYVSAQLRAMDTDIVTSAKFQHRQQKDNERRQRGQGQGAGSAEDERGMMLGGMPGFDPME